MSDAAQQQVFITQQSFLFFVVPLNAANAMLPCFLCKNRLFFLSILFLYAKKKSFCTRLLFFLAREIKTMRLAWFLASCVIASLCMMSIERRLSTLEVTVARTVCDHDELNQNWIQPVFTRLLAVEGASREVFDEKLRKHSNALEGSLRRHEIAVEQKLKVYQESFLGEFKRLKEEIFMGYVSNRAHEELRKEMRKNHENLGKMAKWVQEQIQGHAIKTRV